MCNKKDFLSPKKGFSIFFARIFDIKTKNDGLLMCQKQKYFQEIQMGFLKGIKYQVIWDFLLLNYDTQGKLLCICESY